MAPRILLPDLDAAEPAVSGFELRRFLAGELPAERRAELARLMESDAALKERCETLAAEERAEQAAFALELPLPRFLDEVEQKTARRSPFAFLRALRLQGALGALVATAAALFFFVRAPDDELAGTRDKGGARVGFFVKDEGGAHPGKAGEELFAGDRIQFAVRDDGNKSAMVLVGVDSRGAVTVYAAESVSGRTKGDEKTRLLPASVVLDEATGPERFFVVYGEGSVDELKAQVESAARQLAASGERLDRALRLPLPDSLAQSSVHILKVESPSDRSPDEARATP